MSKRGLQPSDVGNLRLISDVQLSPDGRLVAYVVKTPDLAGNAFRAQIWIADAQTGSASPVTSGRARDIRPRWSPDSTRLAFLSDREHEKLGPQQSAPYNLYMLDVGRGGDPQRLTDFGDDVSLELTYPIITEGYAWAPDGETLCVSVKDPEPVMAPTVYSYDRLRYKSGEYGWWDGRRRHLWLVSTDARDAQRLTSGPWDAFGPVFSPDGSMVAYSSGRAFDTETTNTLPDSSPFSGKDIWLAYLGDGRAERRLTDADGPNMTPSFSGDGARIAYFGHRQGPTGWGHNTHLWVRSLDGGDPVDVLEGWDHTAGSHVMSDVHDVMAPSPAAWSPDGKTLFFQGTVRGAANLYRADAGGGGVRAVTSGDHELQLVSLSRDCTSFAALVSDGRAPADIYLGDVESGDMRQLTAINEEFLKTIHISPVERTSVPVDGREIDVFVIRPAKGSPRPPMVLEILPSFVHGRAFNFEHQMLAGVGCVVLCANPRGATSYGEQFLADSSARGDYLSDDDELLTIVDAIAEREGVDGDRVGVTGDALGGVMTNWLITKTDRFAAACSRRGYSRLWPPMSDRFTGLPEDGHDIYEQPSPLLARSPITRVARVNTPLLLIHSFCLRAGTTEAEELFTALRAMGKEARLLLLRSTHHFLVRTAPPQERVAYFQAVAAWFAEHLALGGGDRSRSAPSR